MDQERAMMIFLSYQKLRMPTFSVRQRRTENPLRERLLVRKFIAQLETYYYYQQQQQQQQLQWQYYKEQETMTSTNSQTNQPDEQINQMDVDREIDEQNETEDEISTSEDDDDSVCSIVMSTTDENNNSVSLDTSDLMKNYALMLEVPTALSTSNDQI
jgi:hypothetical protein